MGTLEITPVTPAGARAFVAAAHRHNKPPTGHKFSIGLMNDGVLVGVVMVGRPVARALDDGRTAEVNRTRTDGTPNANSMLYGAAWRAAKAMGYLRAYTYTQSDESGASLRAAGWRVDATLAPRGSWRESSIQRAEGRDEVGNGGVARVRWIIGTPRS